MWSVEPKAWVRVDTGASNHDGHSPVNKKTRISASDSIWSFLEDLQMECSPPVGWVSWHLRKGGWKCIRDGQRAIGGRGTAV